MGKRKRARQLATESMYERVRKGVREANEGRTKDLGDFSKYAAEVVDLTEYVSDVKFEGLKDATHQSLKFDGLSSGTIEFEAAFPPDAAKRFFEAAVPTPLRQPKVVYISGPMQGYPDHNFAAFNSIAAALREQGYEVVNPAENFEGRTDVPRDMCLREDLKSMADKCNAIYLLDGWQNSAGARLEYLFARECGFEVVNSEVVNDPDASEPVELEASRIVRNGERQKNYGHPNADFQRTAAMWSAILGTEVTMQDMALCMAALKISRLKSTPGHHDSLVDMIGYAICYDRLGEET